jgi:hypothetical protein
MSSLSLLLQSGASQQVSSRVERLQRRLSSPLADLARSVVSPKSYLCPLLSLSLCCRLASDPRPNRLPKDGFRQVGRQATDYNLESLACLRLVGLLGRHRTVERRSEVDEEDNLRRSSSAPSSLPVTRFFSRRVFDEVCPALFVVLRSAHRFPLSAELAIAICSFSFAPFALDSSTDTSPGDCAPHISALVVRCCSLDFCTSAPDQLGLLSLRSLTFLPANAASADHERAMEELARLVRLTRVP